MASVGDRRNPRLDAADSNYVRLLTCSAGYVVSPVLHTMEDQLWRYDFHRTSRSSLVNMTFIDTVKPTRHGDGEIRSTTGQEMHLSSSIRGEIGAVVTGRATRGDNVPLYEIDGWRPEMPASAWIAPSADLIGAVRLGEDVSVWFGAVIRADNTDILVGDRTNVQEGATLHSDPGSPLIIGADCTIGHRAILHGCTIGHRALIGMGAIVLNDAVIGDDCIVGAGALVTEGKTFAAGSLIVGSPARAIRSLDDGAKAMLKASATHYVARQRRFAAGLQRLD